MSKKRTKASTQKRKKLRLRRKQEARQQVKAKKQTTQQGKRGETDSEKPQPSGGYLEMGIEELEAIIDKAKESPLSKDDYEALKATVETLAFLTQELEAKGASIQRLRKLVFGASTEKTSKVTGEQQDEAGRGASDLADADADDHGSQKKKRKGHGRNGAAAYRGAEKVPVSHESLKHGDACPRCLKGKVYKQNKPSVIVRVQGMAPIQATVYERERLRCNLCGDVFTAKPPEGVGQAKYDETAAGMIALLKYGCGLPFNRLERLERGLGIPLPATTQWEVVKQAEEHIAAAHAELLRQAAQGEVLYNDDTTVKILAMMAELAETTKDSPDEDTGGDDKVRTGMFTSGIVATGNGHRIALFFSGGKHAGENLEDLLKKRAKALGAPIQMCDALSRNTSGDFETIVANCIAHARRKFVDVASNFPDEVRHVLEELRTVYKNDAVTRQQELSPVERLQFHQQHSGPVMEALNKWLQALLDEKQIEPNSTLGDAIGYMLGHWEKLTLFLRTPGAPLDNNLCERALKKAILHRKNSLFYKTENGARVGDTYMSIIHTCELNDVDAFDYLVALQRHHDEVAKEPAKWMPWTYQATLTELQDAEPSAAPTS